MQAHKAPCNLPTLDKGRHTLTLNGSPHAPVCSLPSDFGIIANSAGSFGRPTREVQLSNNRRCLRRGASTRPDVPVCQRGTTVLRCNRGAVYPYCDVAMVLCSCIARSPYPPAMPGYGFRLSMYLAI